MKVIGIVKNNCVTGVEYGLIEIADSKSMPLSQKKHKKNNSKKIKNNKKHNSVKNAHIKTECVEKETKIASSKKTKRRYHIHATIVCSYNFKSSKKPVDLNKKHFKKAKDLFKKKQRKNKIELQNKMNKTNIIVPIFDLLQLINTEKQKTK